MAVRYQAVKCSYYREQWHGDMNYATQLCATVSEVIEESALIPEWIGATTIFVKFVDGQIEGFYYLFGATLELASGQNGFVL